MEHGDHVISVLRHTLSLLQHPMDELLVRVPMVLHNDVVHLEHVITQFNSPVQVVPQYPIMLVLVVEILHGAVIVPMVELMLLIVKKPMQHV